jgi:ATP-dependent protease Clp ATPase subunit
LLDGLPLELPTSTKHRHPQAPTMPFAPARLLVVGVACIDATETSTDADLRASLRQLGLRPELVARFDRVVAVPALDEAALAAVAGHAAGPVAEARRFVQGLGGTLEWTLEAIQVIARAAAASGHGGWALRWPVQRQLEEVFAAETPARTWRIDAAAALALVEGSGAARGPYR